MPESPSLTERMSIWIGVKVGVFHVIRRTAEPSRRCQADVRPQRARIQHRRRNDLPEHGVEVRAPQSARPFRGALVPPRARVPSGFLCDPFLNSTKDTRMYKILMSLEMYRIIAASLPRKSGVPGATDRNQHLARLGGL
jgi:hypothetical protein